jgi:putative flippase GtrA
VSQSLEEQSAAAAPAGSGAIRRWLAVLARQLGWFTGIGVVMTLAYLALYAALRLVMGAQAANVVSWVVTAVGDTSANRRFTFGVHGRPGAMRAQALGMLIFGLGLGITSGALFALDAAVAEPGRALELTVLGVANLVAGLLRFVLLRWWVFAPGR